MEEGDREGASKRRTSDIPNGERDVLVLDGLDVETCVDGSQRRRREDGGGKERAEEAAEEGRGV